MKRLIQATITTALLFSACAHAGAIYLEPDDAVADGSECADSCGPKVKDILSYLDAEVDGFDSGDLSYKGEEDGDATGTNKGPFADLYTTTFSNPVGDPSDATISWDGGDWLEGADWLLVKDGNNAPVWYLFDLTGWDGMMDIVLTGFWPGSDKGAISFVAIYGGDPVPEPGTLALFGIGLAGAAMARRKRKAAS